MEYQTLDPEPGEEGMTLPHTSCVTKDHTWAPCADGFPRSKNILCSAPSQGILTHQLHHFLPRIWVHLGPANASQRK